MVISNCSVTCLFVKHGQISLKVKIDADVFGIVPEAIFVPEALLCVPGVGSLPFGRVFAWRVGARVRRSRPEGEEIFVSLNCLRKLKMTCDVNPFLVSPTIPFPPPLPLARLSATAGPRDFFLVICIVDVSTEEDFPVAEEDEEAAAAEDFSRFLLAVTAAA